MRQTLSRGMVAAAAATSVLSLCGSPAYADADAVRSSGPGTSAQDVPAPDSPDAAPSEDRAPAEDPYGDSGYGDEGYGDGGYGDGGDGGYGDGAGSHGGSGESGGASAEAVAEGSPGVVSGNTVQVPVDVPVNVCGNSVDVIGVLNPTFGNRCENGHGDPTPPAATPPTTPQDPPSVTPPLTPPTKAPPAPAPDGGHVPPVLAETGSGALLGAATSSAALILAGAVLYRRSRRA